jgi:hypothetical protein
MAKPDLADYVDVAERLAKFHERYPEGSLQGDYQVREIGEQTVIVYRAVAYRIPDDKRPGIGFASEPYPGKTGFTRDAELMNAETSAWGRALAALGFEVHRGIASKQEVANRQDNGGGDIPLSPKQRDYLENLLKKQLDSDGVNTVMAWAADNLTGGRDGTGSKAIDTAKEADGGERLLAAARAWQAEQSDLPVDETDLPDPDEREGEGTLL